MDQAWVQAFMVEMNIQSVLKDLGVEGVEVAHYDMGSAAPELADTFFCRR